jgi:hypothetical protein
MQKYSALFPLRAERASERRSVFVGALRAAMCHCFYSHSARVQTKERKNQYTHRVADWMSQLNKLFCVAAPMEI